MANSRGSQAAISITFMATGLTLMIGGISGNLAPMIAALFDPSLLVPRPANQGSSIVPIAPIVSTSGVPATNPTTGAPTSLPTSGAPQLAPGTAPQLGPTPSVPELPPGPSIPELPPVIP